MIYDPDFLKGTYEIDTFVAALTTTQIQVETNYNLYVVIGLLT